MDQFWGARSQALDKLDALKEEVSKKQGELYHWANQIDKELSKAMAPLFKQVVRHLTGDAKLKNGSTALSSDRGITCLHRARYDALDDIRKGSENLLYSVGYAQFFAQALLVNEDPYHPAMEKRRNAWTPYL